MQIVQDIFLVYLLLLFKTEHFNFDANDYTLIKNIFISLLVFSILNLYNRNYLGDNGAYFLGFLTSLISIYFFTKYSIPSLLIVAFFLSSSRNLYLYNKKVH